MTYIIYNGYTLTTPRLQTTHKYLPLIYILCAEWVSERDCPLLYDTRPSSWSTLSSRGVLKKYILLGTITIWKFIGIPHARVMRPNCSTRVYTWRRFDHIVTLYGRRRVFYLSVISNGRITLDIILCSRDTWTARRFRIGSWEVHARPPAADRLRNRRIILSAERINSQFVGGLSIAVMCSDVTIYKLTIVAHRFQGCTIRRI